MSDSLPTFFDRLSTVNPFLENRVNGPILGSCDVPDVHGQASNRLIDLAHEALRIRRGLGVVLWGEAGVGKSHVLGRVRLWAENDRAHLVYIHNLQASPEGLARSFLRAVVNQLLGGRRDHWQLSPMYQLVKAGILEATSNEKKLTVARLERLYRNWLNNLGPALSESQVWDVLFAFFRSTLLRLSGRDDGRAANLAVRWLNGWALDPEEAPLLGLPPARHRGEGVALADAQEIKQVFVALSRLAASQERPFILAIDQVDNLDAEQFSALSRFLEALLDSACNLLVITTCIQRTLNEWHDQRVIQASAWDRLAQFEVLLQRLPVAQARLLIQRRIDDFFSPLAPDPAIAQLRQNEPLFPLSQAWFGERLGKSVDVRARDAISWAREAWHAEQLRLAREGCGVWLTNWSGQVKPPPPVADESLLQLIDAEVERELQRYRERLRNDSTLLSPDGDRLADVLHHLLQQCAGDGRNLDVIAVQRDLPPRRDVQPTYHLRLRRKTAQGEHLTGILALCTPAKTSTAGYLRRLANDTGPIDRVVVVIDARFGLQLAEKGLEYRTTLQARGKNHYAEFTLSTSELQELEALQGVVNRARAGDVEISSGTARAVSAEDAIDSHHRHGRYLQQRLLEFLLHPGS